MLVKNKMSNFCISNSENEYQKSKDLSKKENELLRDTLSLMAAELEAVKDSFQDIKN